MEIMVNGLFAFAALGGILYSAIPILRYHQGQDRTFYFRQAHYNQHIEGVLFFIIFFVYRLAWFTPLDQTLAFGIMLLVVVLWSPLARWLLYRWRLRPMWVRRFERQHLDTLAIRAAGQELLEGRLTNFQAILRNPEGWDAWVITVTKPPPFDIKDFPDVLPLLLKQSWAAGLVFGMLIWDSWWVASQMGWFTTEGLGIEFLVFYWLSFIFAFITWVYMGIFYTSDWGQGWLETQFGLWVLYVVMIVITLVSQSAGMLYCTGAVLGLWILANLNILVARMSISDDSSEEETLFSDLALLGCGIEVSKILFLIISIFFALANMES